MKKELILICVLLTGCCSHPFENWSKADTYRQLAYTAAHTADWLQTRRGICGSKKFHELNPVLGEDPGKTEVDLAMGAVLVSQVLISSMLKPGYREAWQYIMIGSKAQTVVWNYRSGIRIDF